MTQSNVQPDSSTATGIPWWVRFAIFIAVGVAGMLVSMHLDKPVYERFAQVMARHDYNDEDLYRSFRVMGYLPVWIMVALVFVLVDSRRWKEGVGRVVLFRGVMLVLAVGLSGLMGEVVKILVRRERPLYHAGDYVFRPYSERFWETTGFGLPSSHAVVAFAAAWMLSRIHPRGTPIFVVFAIGCGMTRILATAHFVSDVYAASLLSYAVVWLLWQWHLANERRFLRNLAATEPAADPANTQAVNKG